MSAWAEEPVVDVLYGVVRANEERRLRWELSQVDGDVEHLSNHSLGVGEEREREIAKVALEARQFFSGTGADANDGTTNGGKQIMLFLEGKASSLARGGIVPRVEENDAPCAIKRGAVKGFPVLVFKNKARGILSDDVGAHGDHSVWKQVPHPCAFCLHVGPVVSALPNDDGDAVDNADAVFEELVSFVGVVGYQFDGCDAHAVQHFCGKIVLSGVAWQAQGKVGIEGVKAGVLEGVSLHF